MALVAGPLVVVTQLVTVDGVKIMSRLTDPAASHARLGVGRMVLISVVTVIEVSVRVLSIGQELVKYSDHSKKVSRAGFIWSVSTYSRRRRPKL